MKLLTKILRRLTRHYVVKHTHDRWVLLHFHSWDHTHMFVDQIYYSNPTPLKSLPKGFTIHQFRLPCTTSTTPPVLQLSSRSTHPSIRESRFAQKM